MSVSALGAPLPVAVTLPLRFAQLPLAAQTLRLTL